MRSTRLVVVVLGSSLLGVSAAQAVSLTFAGSASGTFGTPTPPAVSVTGVGTNSLSFGSPTPNVIQLNGQQFSTQQDANFPLAALSYFNGLTAPSVTTIPTTLTVAFTMPSGVTESLPFNFMVDITPNTSSNPVNNADILTLVDMSGGRVFADQGQTFMLQLEGLSLDQGASFPSQIAVLEGATIHPLLFAQITPVSGGTPSPVPELSTAFLMLLGTGALFACRVRL